MMIHSLKRLLLVAVTATLSLPAMALAGSHDGELQYGCRETIGCCRSKVETEKEEKHCWQVECDKVCIPEVVLPWQAGGSKLTCFSWLNKKQGCGSRACGSCADSCCDPCGKCCGNGDGCCCCRQPRCGRVICVRDLKKEKYECEKCVCKWDNCDSHGCCGHGGCQNRCCQGGCGGDGRCDGVDCGCDVGSECGAILPGCGMEASARNREARAVTVTANVLAQPHATAVEPMATR